jgi:hypothetical protein
MWTFDRSDRLRAPADRAAAMAEGLRREAMEFPRGSAVRATIALRLAVLERRLARHRLLARVARHNARAAA